MQSYFTLSLLDIVTFTPIASEITPHVKAFDSVAPPCLTAPTIRTRCSVRPSSSNVNLKYQEDRLQSSAITSSATKWPITKHDPFVIPYAYTSSAIVNH